MTRRRASTRPHRLAGARGRRLRCARATAQRVQSFVDEVPEDACARARAFDAEDASPAAQHARRACRLAALRAPAGRGAPADRWPPSRRRARRAVREMDRRPRSRRACSIRWRSRRSWAAASSNYGRGVLVERPAPARARRARRPARDELLGSVPAPTAPIARARRWARGVRWILGDRDFSPFVGHGLLGHLGAAARSCSFDPMTGANDFLDGQRARQQREPVGGRAARGQLRAPEPRVPFRIRVLHGSELERHATARPARI